MVQYPIPEAPQPTRTTQHGISEQSKGPVTLVIMQYIPKAWLFPSKPPRTVCGHVLQREDTRHCHQ